MMSPEEKKFFINGVIAVKVLTQGAIERHLKPMIQRNGGMLSPFHRGQKDAWKQVIEACDDLVKDFEE